MGVNEYKTEVTLGELRGHYQRHFMTPDEFIELVKAWYENQITPEMEKKELHNKIIEIANNYHERDILSSASSGSGNLPCGYCEKSVSTVYSIEHDSQDYSKDLNVCYDCYMAINNRWKEFTPNKICPMK